MIIQGKRYGIVAGSGLLPITLAERLTAEGVPLQIARIAGEADPALNVYNGIELSLERIAHALPFFKMNGTTHLIFAGGVKRRPNVAALRVPVSLWSSLPSIALALTRGDDGLLATLVRLLERHGISMVGAHDILPDHVAAYGVISGTKPLITLNPTIAAGVHAAVIIGTHDIGQAVVAFGRRVIAVEGIEGTDQMLARVAALRATGRINSRAKLVLIKIAKPGQELRADMPVIGPDTIAGCKAAGIGLICVSANSTMIMDVERTIHEAKLAKVSIIGIDPAEWETA